MKIVPALAPGTIHSPELRATAMTQLLSWSEKQTPPVSPPFSKLWSFFADFGSCPRNTTVVGGDNAGDELIH